MNLALIYYKKIMNFKRASDKVKKIGVKPLLLV